ncbi:DUF6470 family protein [Paenibacillus sp. FJAT-26967]|uniref:DUF6470 family protein n=1 Tax=Paenibacillus sp. FJAT-26967 TaxID=1729690 RepID=UPI0008383A11|nr:DUF6470 family protein [Paenibacillus sp. FJAT-26967]
MELPRIQINQQYTKVGLSKGRSELSIEQPKVELNLHQENPQVNISTGKSSLEIDSTKAWSALGSSKLIEMRDRIAQSSVDVSMNYIAEIAQNGDRMMDITNKSSAFVDIARQNAFKDRHIELTGEPSYDNVDVLYTPGTISTEVSKGSVTFDPEYHKPVIQYDAGKLEAYIIQKNAITFSVVGGKFNASI